MHAIRSLLAHDRGARRFFAAYGASALGTGLTFVALPLLALDRFGGTWAVAGLLLADLLPVMILGPLLGACADRWPRHRVAIAADLLRAAALVGIAATDSFVVACGLATLVGAGTGLFRPAILSGLPSLAGAEREGAATSLYTALTTAGQTAGALGAAVLFTIASPALALLLDAATFSLSAIVLTGTELGRGTATRALRVERRAAGRLHPMRSLPGLATIACAASAVALAAGMTNVAEPAFVTRELDAGASGFALAVAAWGLGFVLGSVLVTDARRIERVRALYVVGIALAGAGLATAAAVDVFAVALLAFAVNGVGNGLVIVQERALVRSIAGEHEVGRAFGLVDTAASWSLAAAVLGAGALTTALGSRTTVGLAGAGTMVVAALVAAAFVRRRPVPALA